MNEAPNNPKSSGSPESSPGAATRPATRSASSVSRNGAGHSFDPAAATNAALAAERNRLHAQSCECDLDYTCPRCADLYEVIAEQYRRGGKRYYDLPQRIAEEVQYGRAEYPLADAQAASDLANEQSAHLDEQPRGGR